MARPRSTPTARVATKRKPPRAPPPVTSETKRPPPARIPIYISNLATALTTTSLPLRPFSVVHRSRGRDPPPGHDGRIEKTLGLDSKGNPNLFTDEGFDLSRLVDPTIQDDTSLLRACGESAAAWTWTWISDIDGHSGRS